MKKDEEYKYNISPHLIVIKYNNSTNEYYILSLEEKSILLPRINIDDKNKDYIDLVILNLAQDYLLASSLDIFINYIDIHCKELENFYNDKNTIYPIYGVCVSENIKNKSAYWNKINLLEPNYLSYSISRVLQNSTLSMEHNNV
jgi:hypothetical protein